MPGEKSVMPPSPNEQPPRFVFAPATPSPRLLGCTLVGVSVLLLLSATLTCAHPADQSRLNIRMERERIEFRYTLNLKTLARIAILDANRDGNISYDEIEKAAPAVAAFLVSNTLVTLNDEDADLGKYNKHECIWPSPTQQEITREEAGQRYVDFHFTKSWPRGLQELWLGLQVFEQLGAEHEILATYQQRDEPDTPVSFTANEPDYIFDTGWDAAAEIPPAPLADSALFNKASHATGSLGLLAIGVIVWLALRRW